MSSNTNQHITKYGSENNEDLWYRQPFKWGDSTKITGYKFGGYVVEWDDYNSNNTKVPDQATQANNGSSMYRYYKALAEVKASWNSAYRLIGGVSTSDQVALLEIGVGNTVYKRVYVNFTGNQASFSQASGTARWINADGTTTGNHGQLKPYSVCVVG